MPANSSSDMIDVQPEKRLAVPGWLLVLAVVVLAPLVLLAIGAGVLAWQWRQQHVAAVAAVQEEVARIQAAGQPITTRDLYAFHDPSSGVPNTSPYWLAVLDSLPEEQFGSDGAALPIVGQGDKGLLDAGEESVLAPAEALLQKYQTTLQLAHGAASQPGECRYPVKFERGVEALLPHAQKIRAVLRLLSLDVHVHAARGNSEEAVRSLESMFAASESLAQQLTLVEHLVRIATQGIALLDTLHVLNTTPLTDEQLVRLQRRIEAADLQAGLTHSLIGERGMGYHAFHNMQRLGAVGGAEGLPSGNAPDGALSRPADLEKYLSILGELIDASREPYPGARRLAQGIEAKTAALAKAGNPLERMKYQMTALVTPAASATFDATGRGLALRDLVRVAIAAKRYELQTGALPTKASDLVPEFLAAVPVDPFDGQTIRFVAGPEEVVVYSIGRDGRDDGGSDPDESSEPDIVVRLKRSNRAVAP